MKSTGLGGGDIAVVVTLRARVWVEMFASALICSWSVSPSVRGCGLKLGGEDMAWIELRHPPCEGVG